MYSWQEAMRILLDMGSSPSTPLGAESVSGACDGLDRASERSSETRSASSIQLPKNKMMSVRLNFPLVSIQSGLDISGLLPSQSMKDKDLQSCYVR